MAPDTKDKAYFCNCPDWNPLIFSDEAVITPANAFMVPSTICLSNHATGVEIYLKIIFFVTKRYNSSI